MVGLLNMKRKICILNFGVNCPSLWPCGGEKLFFFLSEKPEMSVPEFYLVHFKWKEQTCFEDARVRERRRALKPHDLEWQWLDSSLPLRLLASTQNCWCQDSREENKTAFKTRSHVRLHPCTTAEMEPHCTVCHCPSRLQVTSPVHWLCVVGTQMTSSLTVCHLLDLLLTSRWDDLPKAQFSFSCCSQEDSNYVTFWLIRMHGSCFFFFF